MNITNQAIVKLWQNNRIELQAFCSVDSHQPYLGCRTIADLSGMYELYKAKRVLVRERVETIG